jgi:ABC-type Mn2+/Zn2+ transport system ATPase subunit
MQSNYAVEVKNLSFSYSKAKTILKSVNFNVLLGERCLLVGLNGTGKTVKFIYVNITLNKKIKHLGKILYYLTILRICKFS